MALGLPGGVLVLNFPLKIEMPREESGIPRLRLVLD